MSSPDLVFAPADPFIPPASDLLAAMVAEMIALYELPDTQLGTPLAEEEMTPPQGVYLIAWVDGEPVGGGGLRPLPDGTVELKRMYVRPDHRGKGYSGRLLAALEDHARGLGYQTIRLDTGSRQPVALRLYQGAGYREVPAFNINPHAAFWGEKSLCPPS
jgi:GNAT superfamily N-acetyltransferase